MHRLLYIAVAIDPVLDATTARTPGTIPEGVNLMNTLREGAGSFFKKLGDTSSKVIQIAQQYVSFFTSLPPLLNTSCALEFYSVFS